jgi:hypothetical protein
MKSDPTAQIDTWDRGLDVVEEGTAVRVTDSDALRRRAHAFEAKYGSPWHFDVGDGVFVATVMRRPSSGSSRPRCWRSPRSRTRRPVTGSAITAAGTAASGA